MIKKSNYNLQLFYLFWCPINVKVKIMIKKSNYDLQLFYLFWCPTLIPLQDQDDEKVTYSGVRSQLSQLFFTYSGEHFVS